MGENKDYTEDKIKSLEWNEHIRQRPGMYIGKLGDGKSKDDGIYVLIKEVIDNSVDEFIMGFGKNIEVKITDKDVSIRDYGRGIPLGKVVDCVSKINTGAKYDNTVFKKTVGLNGIGTKAVNALCSKFVVQSFREGKSKFVEFSKGVKIDEKDLKDANQKNGTLIEFTPDFEKFGDYTFIHEYIEQLLRNYTYLNTGLTITFNGVKFFSKNGLHDLLVAKLSQDPIYPIIYIKENDFDFAFSHTSTQYGEEYFSFVNGQYTTQGGTHQAAFREAIVKTLREFYKKDYDASDIRSSIVAAISIRVEDPVFESQTKTKLGSNLIEPGGSSVRNYINDIVKRNLDNYLHKNHESAEELQRKILQSEKERKELAGIKKLAKESIKKTSLHNKKLRDCRVHYNTNHERRLESTIFITEGESASGSITKSRNVNTQAVFSLKGKPYNSFGNTKHIVFKNEELNLLQSALNVEEGVDNIRYNNIVIATDADVDGMHIRLLLMTFFLQFYLDVVKAGHVYILQTPLFRVRNKRKTIYVYSEEEREKAKKIIGVNPEITRFKGLGEISPDEFKEFIGASIRLEPIMINSNTNIQKLLRFYLGDNTPERRKYVLENLVVEKDSA